MAFGIKFTPLTPAAQLPSRRGSLADVTNTSAHLPNEEVNKAIHYFDAMMKDFFRDNSQSCGDRDDSTSFAQGPMSQFDTVDNMVVDDSESLEEYDVFPDLAFLESINPQQQHFDFSFSMIGDQSSTPESNEYDIGSTQMAELRALLLETFPDGMPEEFDYESILADQHVPSDPLDPFLWNYFQSPIQTEDTPDEQ